MLVRYGLIHEYKHRCVRDTNSRSRKAHSRTINDDCCFRKAIIAYLRKDLKNTTYIYINCKVGIQSNKNFEVQGYARMGTHTKFFGSISFAIPRIKSRFRMVSFPFLLSPILPAGCSPRSLEASSDE